MVTFFSTVVDYLESKINKHRISFVPKYAKTHKFNQSLKTQTNFLFLPIFQKS